MIRSEQELLDAVMASEVWEFGDFTFASGKTANNKIQLPKVLDTIHAKGLLLGRMAELIQGYQPDMLWGVPDGGQEFAKVLGEDLGVPLLELERDEEASARMGTKIFKYVNDDEIANAEVAEKIVGIEDVSNELTSVVSALDLPVLSRKTVAVVIGFRRGSRKNEQPVSVPLEAAIDMPIPNIIDHNHPFFRKYGHLALGLTAGAVD